VHCRRTGLKSIKLATSRLLAGKVEYQLVRVRDIDIDWFLTEDHIERISFWVRDGD
jgi:hypothetical protein